MSSVDELLNDLMFKTSDNRKCFTFINSQFIYL